MKSSIPRISLHILVISTLGGMFMKQIISIAQMLGLVAEMDPAGSNYPGVVPWWCLATPRSPFIEQLWRYFRGWSNCQPNYTTNYNKLCDQMYRYSYPPLCDTQRGGYLGVSRVSRVKNYTKEFQKTKTRRENEKTKNVPSTIVHSFCFELNLRMLNKSCSSHVQCSSSINSSRSV